MAEKKKPIKGAARSTRRKMIKASLKVSEAYNLNTRPISRSASRKKLKTKATRRKEAKAATKAAKGARAAVRGVQFDKATKSVQAMGKANRAITSVKKKPVKGLGPKRPKKPLSKKAAKQLRDLISGDNQPHLRKQQDAKMDNLLKQWGKYERDKKSKRKLRAKEVKKRNLQRRLTRKVKEKGPIAIFDEGKRLDAIKEKKRKGRAKEVKGAAKKAKSARYYLKDITERQAYRNREKTLPGTRKERQSALTDKRQKKSKRQRLLKGAGKVVKAVAKRSPIIGGLASFPDYKDAFKRVAKYDQKKYDKMKAKAKKYAAKKKKK
jgi:hypothetical protein